jgi:hypothetical protein
MAFGGPGNRGSAGAAAQFGARMITGGGASNTLTLAPYAGNLILINGITVTVPALGFTRLVSDDLITALGADSGGPGSPSTLYYVYVSNALASFSPSSIRLSATAPTLVNGVKYLGAAGNALNWRFVGWVFLNATPQFESDIGKQLICNYYNRLSLPLFTCPQYVDADTFTEYTVPLGAAYAPINGGVADFLEFISNGEDAIQVQAQVFIDDADIFRYGIGVDSNTGIVVGAQVSNTESEFTCDSIQYSETLSEGHHSVYLNALSLGAGSTVVASMAYEGSAHAPAATYIQASIAG